MEENFNSDPNISETPKTSSTDGRVSGKTTGESQVQDGTGVEDHEIERRPYEKSDDEQKYQEYVEQANNNTEVANESPVKDGKGMTM